MLRDKKIKAFLSGGRGTAIAADEVLLYHENYAIVAGFYVGYADE